MAGPTATPPKPAGNVKVQILAQVITNSNQLLPTQHDKPTQNWIQWL